VWISGGSRLVRFDAATLRIRARLWVRGAIAAVGERALWILSDEGKTASLRKLDPHTNPIVRTFQLRG